MVTGVGHCSFFGLGLETTLLARYSVQVSDTRTVVSKRVNVRLQFHDFYAAAFACRSDLQKVNAGLQNRDIDRRRACIFGLP